MDPFALLLCLALVTALLWYIIRIAVGAPSTRGRAAIRLAAILVIALLLLGAGVWRLTNARSIQLLGTIVPRVETDEKVVALTFDDGPYGPGAERIRTVLDSLEVRATFFLNGRDIERDPALTRLLVAAGHEIGNHSYSHPVMLGLSQRRIRDEVERTDELIRSAGHQGEIHFRSPYGKKFVALPWYLWRNRRTNIFWDVEPDSDRETARDAARIIGNVERNARPGSIILLHVMGQRNEPSLAAVPGIVSSLRARGYRFITVSELLAHR